HRPLFEDLASHGFRIIAFDYMGQGGSSGSMNDMRIQDISTLGEQVWIHFYRPGGRLPKVILGWSAGGLAAYKASPSNHPSALVLMAPALVPRSRVGRFTMSDEWPYVQMTITPASLTRDSTKSILQGRDPHLEPIWPDSPQKAPDFSID